MTAGDFFLPVSFTFNKNDHKQGIVQYFSIISRFTTFMFTNGCNSSFFRRKRLWKLLASLKPVVMMHSKIKSLNKLGKSIKRH